MVLRFITWHYLLRLRSTRRAASSSSNLSELERVTYYSVEKRQEPAVVIFLIVIVGSVKFVHARSLFS